MINLSRAIRVLDYFKNLLINKFKMENVKDYSLHEKVKLMVKLNADRRIIEADINNLKKYSVDTLKKSLSVLTNGTDILKLVDFKRWELEKELAFILRTVPKTSKIIKIPVEGFRYDEFNLTKKYGLKIPNEWGAFQMVNRIRNHSFITIDENKNLTVSRKFNNDQWDSEKNEHVRTIETQTQFIFNFSEIKNHSNVKFEKVEKYLFFLEEILKLRKRFETFEDSEIHSTIANYRNLSEYSDVKRFIEVANSHSSFIKKYESYLKTIEKLSNAQEKLFEKIQKYNKPAKLLFKIQDPKFVL